MRIYADQLLWRSYYVIQQDIDNELRACCADEDEACEVDDELAPGEQR